MITLINIKPLSVNEAWKGRRFKTDKYKSYEMEMFYRLPSIKLPDPPLKVYYEFGFSRTNCDIDNPVKTIQDILQKKYGFDDKDIFEMVVKKVKVKTGEEYLKFEFKNLDNG